MDNQIIYRELAVIKVQYWCRTKHKNFMFGCGIAYGYLINNVLFTGDLYSADYDNNQEHYHLSSNRVISRIVVDNLHDLKKALQIYGHDFDQDSFILFLKHEKVAFHTHPLTKSEKLHSQQLSDELRGWQKNKKVKQHMTNKNRKLCKYLRKLGRKGDYKQFLELLFKYYKNLDRNHTTINDIKRIVYNNDTFRMPNNVRKSLPDYGIMI